MIIDLFNVDTVHHAHVGGKGYNLHKLHKAGLPVPRAVVIQPQLVSYVELSAKLEEIEWLRGHSYYAVRSSGVGEDSYDKSWAGVFDSYLYVKSSDIPHYVQRVIDSIESSRYRKYSAETGAGVKSIAVVIQEMIDADYAGVAFSASPIEGDERITLIEIVEGVGESLVSSQKTPATLRVNKITNMVRIQQAGDDNIGEDVLRQICDTLMPYIDNIEALYGYPMDIEWAMQGGRTFILQARPITTIRSRTLNN